MNKVLRNGCAALMIMAMLPVGPVYGATLEESMLAPPTSTSAYTGTESETHTQAADLLDLSEEDRVVKIGQMCQGDYARTGILASVSAAQCILESGYLTTDLAVSANNCFGMKAELSGNSWGNSTWDGTSTYTKQTGEEYGGQQVTITADFRKYSCIEDSLGDHSAYLLGATDGDGLRYDGLSGQTDYVEAITIIKNGGYATDSAYISKICSIIERFNLTQYDVLPEKTEEPASTDTKAEQQETVADQAKETVKETASTAQSSDSAEASTAKSTASKPSTLTYLDTLYRVRTSWEDIASQIGAYSTMENARKVCRSGYSIFDSKGNVLYKAK